MSNIEDLTNELNNLVVISQFRAKVNTRKEKIKELYKKRTKPKCLGTPDYRCPLDASNGCVRCYACRKYV